MEIAEALEWAAGRRNGVLITLRRDGRAQSSDIAYAVMGDTIKISVTHDRAKTRNIARDGRVLLHVTNPAAYSYVSIDATAELSDVATAPDDAAVEELIEVYRAVAGDHDDWDEYRRAMVADGRCVIRLTPRSVTGMING
ncbi:MAG: PPOX class F420-dependent oxidoreductase [Acidimicrobiales bacterium]|nr:PPOX class F420-dependent oxidoreductase [Acidimicrobiales bacterium]